jgi:transcriptional regulator with XRE-family HTH domain
MGDETLKSLIRKAGTSYREVAGKLGTTSAHVTRWNKGKTEMGFRTAVRLSKILGTTLEELADSLSYLDDREPLDHSDDPEESGQN